MAVLDQSYRRWSGQATSYVRRILVIPRYDMHEILEKRTWLLAWLACLVPPLILGVYVYGVTNMGTLRALIPWLPPEFQIPPPGADAYQTCLAWQFWLLAAFAVLVGPPLATRDFANGAMALYLSKSLRRWDYVLGRCAVLGLLLSLASWVPYLLIFLLECGMAGPEWRAENWGLFFDIIAATLPLVLLLTLLIVAMGAVVQRAHIARAALLFLLLGMKPLVLPLVEAFQSPNMRVFSLTDVTDRLRERAFEDDVVLAEPRPGARRVAAPRDPQMGGGVASFALLGWSLLFAGVIARRVRPVEVIR